MCVYGIALAGWSSNNKYSLIGGLRSSAQMISYELPLTLVIVSPLLLANTLSFRGIAESQAGYYLGFIPRWNIFQMPFPQIFGFIIFMIAGFAETNRIPFDLAGSGKRTGGGLSHRIQQHEIRLLLHVGIRQHGDHYLRRDAAVSGWLASAVSRALFELGSDAGLPGCCRCFFSRGACRAQVGPHYLSGLRSRLCCSGGYFCHSVSADLSWCRSSGSPQGGLLLFTYIWVRGTLPRFRYDQLMHFAWTFLFPCALDQPAADCALRGGLLREIASMDTFLFIVFAIIAIVCAFNLVLQKHPISSALSLIGVMGSLAVLYLLLGAEFIAMAQMIVYGGAVMVLFIFVIMLLNAGRRRAAVNPGSRKLPGLPLLSRFRRCSGLPDSHRSAADMRRVQFGSWVGGTAEDVGMLLFTNICCRSKSSRF